MEKTIDGIIHIAAPAAAQELGTTNLKILMLIKQGALQGSMVDGVWFVSRPSIDCLIAHGGIPAEQQSCKTSCSASSCGCH